jgi:hypothetical protein
MFTTSDESENSQMATGTAVLTLRQPADAESTIRQRCQKMLAAAIVSMGTEGRFVQGDDITGASRLSGADVS